MGSLGYSISMIASLRKIPKEAETEKKREKC
jgi:hypothetical protein